MSKVSWAILTVAAITTLSSAAQAADNDVQLAGMSRDGYGYIFKDDPLNAGNEGEMTARIKVRKQPTRTLLIRPRWQFVAEMLKSVENL